MTKKTTPMMEQWFFCKKKAKDALLFFRLGDFYEAFYEDAKLIAKEINLTLTKRQDIPMCGVPFHASESYIDKLVAKGYKIAIAEQMENPKDTKGLVKRDVVKVLSPATVINSSLILDKSNNFFISLSQINSLFGLAIIDLTTSEFQVLELENLKDLKDELCKLTPSEFLVSKKFSEDFKMLFEELSYNFKFIVNKKENYLFDHQFCYENLLSHFKVHSLDGFGLKGKIAAINAAGALLNYLKDDLNLNLEHINNVKTENISSYMLIDSSSMKNLEITDPLSKSNKKNTLLKVLDFTLTPMGGRLLKNFLKNPLLDKEEIKKRQDAIEELLNSSIPLDDKLDKIKDLERLIVKITSNLSSPKDLTALKNSLEVIPDIKKILSPFKSLLIKESSQLKNFYELTALIKKAITDSPPFKLSDGNVIRDGYNKDLDDLRNISKNSKIWIANYQKKLREETNIKNLRVGFTKIFGYYIEISKGQINKMPSSFQRRQTLVNSERFISEELKSFEHKILTSEERIKAIETKLYNNIKKEILKFHESIQISSKKIALIDTLHSLAKAAKKYNYTRPLVDNGDIINIEKGKHPVIDANGALNSFTPNDTFLDEKKQRLLLITGPNMAGKSTYIRQVALITIMAQMGSFIPAKSAHIGIVDKIFSRIGASDDLMRGQSTFMVEMIESANILNNATSKSLIILDEIGRGTSTYDGISIAWAIAEYLLKNPKKRAKTLFATHYLELAELEKKVVGAKNYNVAIKETSSGIVFLHKIKRGSSDRSFGIHVAKLAGLPFIAIKRAEEILKNLEKNKNLKKQKFESENYPLLHLSKKPEILEDIKKLDVNSLSPIQALQKLFEIQKKVK
jgi:DNA mismatch repair protein MutS